MDVISTKSFLSFWKKVTKSKIIELALTEAVLEIINRLNFDTDTFEAVINDKSEIIQKMINFFNKLKKSYNHLNRLST